MDGVRELRMHLPSRKERAGVLRYRCGSAEDPAEPPSVPYSPKMPLFFSSSKKVRLLSVL